MTTTVERFQGDDPNDDPVILIGFSPAAPRTEYFAFDAEEARAVAAQLIALADRLDADRPVTTSEEADHG